MNAATRIDRKAALFSETARFHMAQFDRRQQEWARRNGHIAEDDVYGWRVVWIDRLTGAPGPSEVLPYRTRVEAIEAMHRGPISDRWVAEGVERVRTFFEAPAGYPDRVVSLGVG